MNFPSLIGSDKDGKKSGREMPAQEQFVTKFEARGSFLSERNIGLRYAQGRAIWRNPQAIKKDINCVLCSRQRDVYNINAIG